MAARRKDNQTGRLWVEEGEGKVGPLAVVAPVAPIDKLYTFAVPDRLAEDLQIGQRVRVPFGRKDRMVTAFCIDRPLGPWTSTLRFVDSLVDARSYLGPELFELGRWISRHYCCPLGRTLNALVPEAVRVQSGFVTVRYARLLVDAEAAQASARLGAKQKAILAALSASDGPVEVPRLLSESQASSASLGALVRRGWIEVETTKQPPAPPNFDEPLVEPDFELNPAQRAALARIEAAIETGRFHVTLVYGVSGSGKTEVYIRAMRRVLQTGRQVILLVPEIALTTQLVHRVASRFRDVAVFHSGLTGVERSLTWEAVATGQKRVIVGTRSAIFAPCPDLGLIVVDEEQEASYKNLQAPRFGVRDVAIKRAHAASIPIVLGSATPSLESWLNCTRLAHYERVTLPERVRALPLPRVHLVDMRDEYHLLGRQAVLSRLMEEKLVAALERREQAVLLINRRGYASSIFCPRCKHRLECPNCHVSLVFHSAAGQVRCHYCRHRVELPSACPNPSCRSPLVTVGSGTQRVESVLRKQFPTARIARADSDTMLSTPKYQRLIEDFEARKIDVVVGTQMIAKGLDFPFVSFVGVVNADLALSAPDFRAGERLFQLITQVAGRAGRRDRPGEVVVQTTAVDLPALQAAVRQDFSLFAAAELGIRERVRFPPYTRLTRFVLADAHEARAREEANSLADRIGEVIASRSVREADVLGPQPCILRRLRKLYRYDLLLRTSTPILMRDLLDHLRGHNLLRARVKSFVVDVDAISLV